MLRDSTTSAASHTPTEWPTWALIALIYSLWIAALVWYAVQGGLAPWLFLTVVSAWYMSLQHELVHGHPTRSARINRWFGLMPLAVWYPFDIYRDSHLAHHRDELLTFPDKDPESNYMDPPDFAACGAPLRALLVAQRTAVGRLCITPAFAIAKLLQALAQRETWRVRSQAWTWVQHLGVLGLLLWGVHASTGMPVWAYLLSGYFALGLACMRSLYEHRPATRPAHRIVINEAGWFWRLLYLNNNYHAVHHARPALAWYAIPAAYHAERERFINGTGGFLIPGYNRFFLRHLFTPVDAPGQATRQLERQDHKG
jgi:fatty acid desaturase